MRKGVSDDLRTVLRGGVASLAISAFGAFGTPAFAQDGPTLLQRIVVSTGEERVAVDTPQSVTVVSEEDIDRQAPTTVGDLLDEVPNVTAQGSERVLGESYNIRGLGSGEAQSDEGRFILQVDGVDKNYQQYRLGGLFTDPELYKRVEILRGPASSTLYGAGALAGVIAFETKDADDFLRDGETWAVRLKSTYETNSDMALASTIGAWRPHERVSFLLAGNARRGGDYESGNGTNIDAEFESFSGLVKGTAQIGDEGLLNASYQRWQSDAENQQYAQTENSSNFGRVDRAVTDETAILSYENPFSDNPWLDLKMQLSYSDTLNEERNGTGGVFVGPPFAPVFVQFFPDADFRYETWQGKIENTFEATGDLWENYLTIGSQYTHLDRSMALRNTGAQPEGTDEKFGIFFQNEFLYDDRLTLITGMRSDYRNLNPDDSVRAGFAGGAASVDEWAFSPKIAVHYKLNETFGVFGSYSHTERFATLDEVYDYRSGSVPGYDIDKEKSDNFELGVTVSRDDIFTADDLLQVKATGFYNHISGFIARNPRLTSFRGSPVLIPGESAFTNVGDVELYGAELELAYAGSGWNLAAGAAYTIGRDLDNGLSTSGNLNTVPPLEFFLRAEKTFADYDLTVGYRGRFVADQGDVLSSATRFGVPVNGRGPSDGFATHSAYLEWKPDEGLLKDLELQARVDNIFNKQYREFLSNDPGKGRTFSFSLTKRFGG